MIELMTEDVLHNFSSFKAKTTAKKYLTKVQNLVREAGLKLQSQNLKHFTRNIIFKI